MSHNLALLGGCLVIFIDGLVSLSLILIQLRNELLDVWDRIGATPWLVGLLCWLRM